MVPWAEGLTVVQKTHGFTTEHSGISLINLTRVGEKQLVKMNHVAELSHRAILVIRNPFRMLISHRNLDIGGHLSLIHI